jgi:hypothetical protein
MQNFPLRTRTNWTTSAISVVLLVTATVYQVKGHVALIAGRERGDAVDVSLRSAAIRSFSKGLDPFTAWQQAHINSYVPGRSSIGTPSTAGPFGDVDPTSPPWAYPFYFALFWPPMTFVRWYYAGISFLCLTASSWCAWRLLSSSSGVGQARIAAMALLASGATVTATEVGQVSVPVAAALMAATAFIVRGRTRVAGVLIGLALSKPTIATPFLLAALPFEATGVLTGALLTVGLSSCVSYLQIGATPLGWLAHLSEFAAMNTGAGQLTGTSLLQALGVGDRLAVLAPGLAGLFLMGAALFPQKRWSSPLPLFAVAAVVSRYWSYHRSYDDVTLVFVLLAALEATARDNRPVMRLVTGLVLLSLVMPARIHSTVWFQVLQAPLLLASVSLTFGSRSSSARPVVRQLTILEG